jgi:hypothetical protein
MNTRKMAAQATFHCLLGCIIGELVGLEIGRLAGLEMHWTMLLAGALSFVSGYTVSTIPLVRAGLSFSRALRTVLAADTLSILTMVLVDNAIMALIPGAMNKDPLTFTRTIVRIDNVSAAKTVRSALENERPARTSGIVDTVYPLTNDSAPARSIVQCISRPARRPISRPTSSPMIQPSKQ